MNALIIEDELPAREDLRRLLGAHPEVAIVGEAGSVTGARARLAANDYDLVFLDIQLVGGSGFDLVPDVRDGARIIFVTAYDQHALRAFEVNALDYLMKPVARTRLAESLARVPRTAAAPAPALRADDTVCVKTGPGAARFVRVADIVLLVAQDNYSEVHLAEGGHLLVRQTLAAWEERLPTTHFLRVHRQSIVNLSRIEGFENLDREIVLLRVAGSREPVRARRQHWPELCARLSGLGLRLA